MNMIEAVKSSFSKYADFSGRARRAEYWWFTLFNMIASFVVTFVLVLVLAPETMEGADALANLYTLAVLLPSLAVSVRRLHDTGHSGWWLLIALTGVGMILLLVWFVMKGERGPNHYGPDPLQQESFSQLA